LALVGVGAVSALAIAMPGAALLDHRRTTTVAPFEAVAESAEIVRSATPDLVITNRTTGFIVFRWYLGDTFEVIDPERIHRRLCRAIEEDPEVVIAYLDYPFPETGFHGDPACLGTRDTTATTLRHRRSSPGITVWISRPGPPSAATQAAGQASAG